MDYAQNIDHEGGLRTEYWHLFSIDPSIKVGDYVSQGRVIAKSGTSGTTHLHLEFRNALNGAPISAHGMIIDGYTAHAYIRTADSKGYNYEGTLTKGSAEPQSSIFCGNQITKWVGSESTFDANTGGKAVSTNTAEVLLRPDPAKTYRIVSVNSGKGLDVLDAALNNGAVIQQWDYLGGLNQQWRFQDAGDGYYYVRAVHSNKCLEVSGVSLDNGAVLNQWDCVGGDNQKWRLPIMDGTVVMLAKHSQKAADVAGGQQANGARVLQWSRHNAANQRWRIEEVR